MARKSLPECGGITLDFTDSGSGATKLKIFLAITDRKTELREVFDWNELVYLDSIPAGAVTLTVVEATSASNVGSASASATVTAGEWTAVSATGASGTPVDPTSTRLNIGNSYARPGEADEYFANRPESTVWDAATSANREKALIAASKMIDRAHRWLGSKLDGSFQVLEFPRLFQDGAEGRDDQRFIPQEIKDAVFEQAQFLLDKGVFQERKQLQAEGVSSFSVGHLSESYRPGAGGSGLVHLAESKIKPWRARGGKIRGGYDEFPRDDGTVS